MTVTATVTVTGSTAVPVALVLSHESGSLAALRLARPQRQAGRCAGGSATWQLRAGGRCRGLAAGWPGPGAGVTGPRLQVNLNANSGCGGMRGPGHGD